MSLPGYHEHPIGHHHGSWRRVEEERRGEEGE